MFTGRWAYKWGGGGAVMGSLQYVKGVPVVNRRYMKEAPCLSKMVYKRVRGNGPWWEPSLIKRW